MDQPTTFRAGDSVSWLRSVPAYRPTEGWSLKYRLLWAIGVAVAFDATAYGYDYTVSLSSADTSAWVAGAATLVAYVEKGADRVTLDQSPVTVLADLSVADTFDGRSINRRALDDARAALSAYMARGQLHVGEYDIAGRRMKFRSTAEILDLIAYYERQVSQEEAALALMNGGAPPGRVFTRF